MEVEERQSRVLSTKMVFRDRMWKGWAVAAGYWLGMETGWEPGRIDRGHLSDRIVSEGKRDVLHSYNYHRDRQNLDRNRRRRRE